MSERNIRPSPTLPSSVKEYVLPIPLAKTAETFVKSFFMENALDPNFGSNRITLLSFWLQNLQSEGLCGHDLLAQWVRFIDTCSEVHLTNVIRALQDFFSNPNWSPGNFEYFSKSLMVNSLDSQSESPVLLTENEFRVLVSVLIQSNVDTINEEKRTSKITALGLTAFRELYAIVLSAQNERLQQKFDALLDDCKPLYAAKGDLKLAVMGFADKGTSTYLIREMSRLRISSLLG